MALLSLPLSRELTPAFGHGSALSILLGLIAYPDSKAPDSFSRRTGMRTALHSCTPRRQRETGTASVLQLRGIFIALSKAERFNARTVHLSSFSPLINCHLIKSLFIKSSLSAARSLSPSLRSAVVCGPNDSEPQARVRPPLLPSLKRAHYTQYARRRSTTQCQNRLARRSLPWPSRPFRTIYSISNLPIAARLI